MTIVSRSIALAALLFSVVAIAETLPFRVAGIVGLGEKRLVLIEFPGGAHGMFRQGDRLGEGEILEIAKQWVRLSLPEGERRLWLDGAAPNNPLEGKDTIRDGTALTWHADLDAVLRDIHKAQQEPRSDARTTTGREQLNRVLRLPPQAEVVSIDGTPTLSAKDGLETLRIALSRGGGVLLALNGVPGTEQIYLHPQPPASEQTDTQ